MQLRIYDTLARRVVPFTTERPREVRMYTCGPTVYRPVHLGNLRSYLLADWLRRTLTFFGNEVTAVKNITDVGHMRQEAVDRGEDKVIAAALAEGKTPEEIAEFYEARFHQDERHLGILPAAHFPRASDHVPEMIAIVLGKYRRGAAPGRSRRARSREAASRRLRALEESGARPHPDVGFTVGNRVPWLARRMFGDEHPLPRRAIRPSHRRGRQHLSAPRGRDRSERGRLRPSLGAPLGARTAPARRRDQDGQVRPEHLDARRDERAGSRSARLPLRVPPHALPVAHGLLPRRAASIRRSPRPSSAARTALGATDRREG
ncbi:MAG: hypothetical protein E6H84_12155 [Chloroflexi bacterium]|nr:MAG: hypothetical protein E6H84_12155 [Chloroflexota bacterium]